MKDPLSTTERADLIAQRRPRALLPILKESPARRHLPLAEARETDKVYRPLVAVWELTLRCDLACRHCGSRAGKARPNELSTAECLDLVRQLAEIGTREVAIIGGEAYLRDDWLEIIAAIKAHGMLPTMTTGGRGLTSEMAKAAAAAGLFSVAVSIDGEPTTHDRLRGVPGSHASAVAAMKALRAAGVHVASNSQINRLTMPEMPAVLDRLLELGAESWQIQLTVAMGRAADEPDVLLQPYDLLELFPMLAELAERGRRGGLNLVAGNNVGYFGPHETALRGPTQYGHSLSCGAGRSTIGIEADGLIKGCPSLGSDAWGGGNVRDTPLREIWTRATPLRYTRDRTVADLWGFCATCYYADSCRAGCTWTADSLFGRPGNNPYCHHRALELQKQGLRERVVRTKDAPGDPFDRAEFALVVEPWATAADMPR